MGDEELERRVTDLERDHRLTRWYTGRIDRDLAEIAATQTEHTDALNKIVELLQDHPGRFQAIDGRFDSTEAQLQSLTQLVGEVLNRLPGSDEAK